MAAKTNRPDKYAVRYACSNCDWSGFETFNRGVPAPATIECPACGCRTASRGRKTPLPRPPLIPRWPTPLIPRPPTIDPRGPYPVDPRDPYAPMWPIDVTWGDDDWRKERGGPLRNAGEDEQREQRAEQCIFCPMLGGRHNITCPYNPECVRFA